LIFFDFWQIEKDDQNVGFGRLREPEYEEFSATGKKKTVFL
jgi:hypothetical protein